MKIAIEGCCHGELDNIYAALVQLEQLDEVKIDLLICCGDFQAVRDQRDMGCLTVPPKLKKNSLEIFGKTARCEGNFV